MQNKLILDYSKWRCGGEGNENTLGEGPTMLLNPQGFMCCLGQFSPQLSKDVTPEKMLGQGNPQEIKVEIPLSTISEEAECEDDFGNYFLGTDIFDSHLTEEAIEINDYPSTTPEQKIEKLQKLFS